MAGLQIPRSSEAARRGPSAPLRAIVLAVAAAIALTLGLAAQTARGADSLTNSVSGLAIDVPAGWIGSVSALRPARANADRLWISTHEVDTAAISTRCPTRALLGRLPEDGVLVWAMERLAPSRALLRSLPRRPARFTLARRETSGCFRGGYRWRFRTGGRAMTVILLAGAAATTTTKQRAVNAIGSLTVASRVIGHSRQGRPIKLIAAGHPAARKRILVVGCIHGDECAGSAVLRRLRAAPARSSDLWIVPTLNPDGLAARQRQNSAGVDLNRNFPRTWRASGFQGDRYYPGSRPASEPETRAGMVVLERIRPDITIWFHQPETNVRAGGGSERAARAYAALVGLPYLPLPVPAGAATAWQVRAFADSQAFVVELPPGRLGPVAAARHANAVRALGAR